MSGEVPKDVKKQGFSVALSILVILLVNVVTMFRRTSLPRRQPFRCDSLDRRVSPSMWSPEFNPGTSAPNGAIFLRVSLFC